MVLERSEALHKGTEWLATLAAFGISSCDISLRGRSRLSRNVSSHDDSSSSWRYRRISI